MKAPRALHLIATLAALSLPATAQLNTGLLSYWAFDGDLTDSGPGAANGTLVGTNTTPAFTAAKFGQGIDLDGADQHVAIPGSEETYEFAFNPWTIVGDPVRTLQLTGGHLTVSAWFRVDSFDTNWQTLISKGEGTDWRIARTSYSTPSNHLAFCGGSADIPPDDNTGPEVHDGGLHHLVAVTDQTAATRFYVDGVLVGIGAPPNVGDADRLILMIGGNPEVDPPYRRWNGVIDEVMIWQRALSDGECRGLYNLGAGIDGADILANSGAATTDADSDGLPDWWENAYGLSTSDDGSVNPANGPAGDPDGDGLSGPEQN